MENDIQNQRGFTLWFTGLSGAGKTTVAEIVERELKERGLRVEVLDGDIVRTNLSKGLSFSREDRKSTRLNSSHANISYGVYCLKEKHTSAFDVRDPLRLLPLAPETWLALYLSPALCPFVG